MKQKNELFEGISKSIESLVTENITNERKEILNSLVTYLKNKIASNSPIRLNFICTHNSRRSHLSQIWAKTLAEYYAINNVTSYSGGTEATALFPKVAETLISQGFQINTISQGDNPVYSVKYAHNEPPIIGFSKEFSDAFNPNSDFAAIMTCSSADEGCPMVFGCDKRIAITYEDPKVSDGTPKQSEIYLERSLEIATEMKFVFSSLQS